MTSRDFSLEFQLLYSFFFVLTYVLIPLSIILFDANGRNLVMLDQFQLKLC